MQNITKHTKHHASAAVCQKLEKIASRQEFQLAEQQTPITNVCLECNWGQGIIVA